MPAGLGVPFAAGWPLYLGSGAELLVARGLRDRGWRPSGLKRGEWPWLRGATGLGGVLGPLALLTGLQQTSGSTASLLLNLEAVLTAVLAWVTFKENADRRIVAGMIALVAGGLLLSWPESDGTQSAGSVRGPLLVLLACLCWAIDNNFTRKVSASDALFIAGCKGLVAGLVNGALVSLWWLDKSVCLVFWFAGELMAVGVWLHLTERHKHEHTHEPLMHSRGQRRNNQFQRAAMVRV